HLGGRPPARLELGGERDRILGDRWRLAAAAGREERHEHEEQRGSDRVHWWKRTCRWLSWPFHQRTPLISVSSMFPPSISTPSSAKIRSARFLTDARVAGVPQHFAALV